MIAPSPPNPVLLAAQPPDRIKRQEIIVLTQTIVTPDSTRTAVITLGNGGHPDAGGGTIATSAPNDPPAQIGIILGCCLGALVLFIALWFCLSNARRRREQEIAEIEERSFGSSYYYMSGEDSDGGGGGGGGGAGGAGRPARPAATHWPWQSIPPPVVPTYTARDPTQQWRASARATHTVRQ
ncbi:hypothetical protein PG996_006816 [Apiospora saccharicola]|uniref:Mid2 domain-containing protein n=1 Tax=Apiospora saccharicola TaxID=335842 RepID=A0ABR1V923_9PEZI